LIIISANETEVGSADFHWVYGFSRIVRPDPPRPWKSAVPVSGRNDDQCPSLKTSRRDWRPRAK